MVIFGKDFHVDLDGEKLATSNSEMHLGVEITSHSNTSKCIDKRINKTTSTYFAFQSKCNVKKCNLYVCMLFKTLPMMCVPHLLYGCKLVSFSEAEINRLQKNQRKLAKYIQCLPPNTPDPAVYATSGWVPVPGACQNFM